MGQWGWKSWNGTGVMGSVIVPSQCYYKGYNVHAIRLYSVLMILLGNLQYFMLFKPIMWGHDRISSEHILFNEHTLLRSDCDKIIFNDIICHRQVYMVDQNMVILHGQDLLNENGSHAKLCNIICVLNMSCDPIDTPGITWCGPYALHLPPGSYREYWPRPLPSLQFPITA